MKRTDISALASLRRDTVGENPPCSCSRMWWWCVFSWRAGDNAANKYIFKCWTWSFGWFWIHKSVRRVLASCGGGWGSDVLSEGRILSVCRGQGVQSLQLTIHLPSPHDLVWIWLLSATVLRSVSVPRRLWTNILILETVSHNLFK